MHDRLNKTIDLKMIFCYIEIEVYNLRTNEMYHYTHIVFNVFHIMGNTANVKSL